MFKFLVWHVLIGAISCELFNQEVGYRLEYAPTYDNYQPRDYHFNYAVSDPHTGDHKSQWEVKEKGVVRGAYSLLEPDGTTRIVEYIADHDGFRAVVKKLGTAVHPSPVAVPVIAQPLPQLAHFRTYDGQINNYANLAVVQPSLYHIEQSLGGNPGLISTPQALGVVEQVRVETPTYAPSYINAGIQGQNLVGPEAIPYNRPQIIATGQGYAGGIIQNLRPLESAVPQNLGQIETNLGRIEGIPLSQGHNLATIEAGPPNQGYNLVTNLGRIELGGNNQGTIEANLGRIELPENNQGRSEANLGTIESEPLNQGQSLGRIEDILGRIEAVPAPRPEYDLGQIPANLGRVEAEQNNNLGRIEAVSVEQRRIEADLGRIEGVPLRDYNLGGVSLAERQNLGRIEAVPIEQGRIEANLGRIEGVRLPAYNLGRISFAEGQDLGRIEGVSLPQGYNLGQIGGNLGRVDAVQNLEQINNNLGRVDAEVPSQVVLGQRYGQGRVEVPSPVPGLVPVSPSYRTIIEYGGLTGNVEDDSRYTNDHYHGSYSQKIPKVVLSPTKIDQKREKSKEKFLIYYPDSGSQ